MAQSSGRSGSWLAARSRVTALRLINSMYWWVPQGAVVPAGVEHDPAPQRPGLPHPGADAGGLRDQGRQRPLPDRTPETRTCPDLTGLNTGCRRRLRCLMSQNRHHVTPKGTSQPQARMAR